MHAATLFRCPACGQAGMENAGRQVRCGSCGQSFAQKSGYVDLIDATDGEPTASSVEQRLMESELVARVYERF